MFYQIQDAVVSIKLSVCDANGYITFTNAAAVENGFSFETAV